MESSFQNIINFAFYAGALQGIILMIFLFNSKVNVISCKLLGTLTFCWAIILLVFALQSEGLYLKFPHLLFTAGLLVFQVMPLLYLSIKYLVTDIERFNNKDWLHFLPFVIGILLYSQFYFHTGEEKIIIARAQEGYYSILTFITNETVTLQGIIYPILSLILINKYNKNLPNFQSNVDVAVIKGMKVGTILLFISWMIGALDVHLKLVDISLGVDLFIFVYLFIVIIIYVISYVALKSPETFKLSDLQINQAENLLINQPTVSAASETTILENIGSDNKKEHELREALNAYIQREKPYLDPKLSLQDIADSLEYNRHQVSALINQHYGMNFYEFINSYRVTEVKKLMVDPEHSNQKLIYLAYDAGFNSKASFNRIFKQMEKKTPSEYRRSIIT